MRKAGNKLASAASSSSTATVALRTSGSMLETPNSALRIARSANAESASPPARPARVGATPARKASRAKAERRKCVRYLAASAASTAFVNSSESGSTAEGHFGGQAKSSQGQIQAQVATEASHALILQTRYSGAGLAKTAGVPTTSSPVPSLLR